MSTVWAMTPNFATCPAPTVTKTLKQVMSKYGNIIISPYKVKMHIIYTTGSLYYIVHDPEGQSVPSELNKVHCAFWEDIQQKRMIAVGKGSF